MRRQTIGRKLTAIVLAAGLAVSCTACGAKTEEKKTAQTLRVWYYEEGMEGYLKFASEQYEKKTGVKIDYQQVDAKDYLETINQTSLSSEKELPDVYLLRNDMLGQACMKGLAAANQSEVYTEKQYCKTALEAATYADTLMAYPLYYETACMLSNTDYFPQSPATMGAITAFSEQEEIGENIQYILYWDVNDYLCNYAFVGNYMDIGGIHGDQTGEVSIVNDQTIQCLQKYQELGQYFAIDSESIDAQDVPAALMEERTLCILADTDMVHIVNWYAVNHGVDIPYHISPIPALTDDLQSRTGSYTELAVVNGLGTSQELAADFATYISYDFAGELYDASGHFAAKRKVSYQNKELENLYAVYEESKPFPKLLEAQDNRVWLEVLFSNVWKGLDIATELQTYADKLASRIQNP